MAWLFVAAFLLLGVLLVLQVTRWLIRRSPRTRSFQLVAEAAGDAVFEMDLASRKLWCKNPTGLGLDGIRSNDDLQIGTDTELVHPGDRDELSSGWDRLTRGEQLDLHVRLRNSGGNWVWVQITAISGRGRGQQGPRAYGMIRHTNDLHEHQAALAETRRLETVGTMAGGVAHEFNNYLTPVRGYLELALAELPADTPTHTGLETALNQVLRCSELISQVQAYGRKSMMFPQPMDLGELLAEIPGIVDQARTKLGGRAQHIRLIKDWPETLPDVVIDQAQFHKAMEHLISNAMEAMPNGGELWVEAEGVRIDENTCSGNRDASPGSRVMVRITDTGRGIPEPLQQQVMDPFFTTHGRASAQGMGLPMVQGMMAQLGGWMQIRSIEGLGTTVELFFPVRADAETDEDPDAESPTWISSPAGFSGRVLIADDERCVRDLAGTVFAEEGWGVEEACDFDEVMSRFVATDEPEPDVVLLDLAMPGPLAEEAIQVIRASSPDVLILLMSGYARSPRIDAMVGLRDVEYISKPFSPGELLAKVHAMMGGMDIVDGALASPRR